MHVLPRVMTLAAIAFSALCFEAEAEPQFTTVAVPNARQVWLVGISNGQAIGNAIFSSGGDSWGFIRNADGSLIYLDGPVTSIDALGDVTGVETVCSEQGANLDCFGRGFVRKTDGTVIHLRLGKGEHGSTFACCIKSNGWVAGWFFNDVQGQQGTVTGFLKNLPGRAKRFSVHGLDTYVAAMTSSGTLFGNYYPKTGFARGFIRTPDGHVKTFSARGAGVEPAGINAHETVTGDSYDDTGLIRGFVRTSDGAMTIFDAPGSTGETTPLAIDNSGSVAGYYVTGAVAHGFIRSSDGAFTTVDVPGATLTTILGMDEKGDVVGAYVDQSGNQYGFIRTP